MAIWKTRAPDNADTDNTDTENTDTDNMLTLTLTVTLTLVLTITAFHLELLLYKMGDITFSHFPL